MKKNKDNGEKTTYYAPAHKEGGNKRCFCPSVRPSIRPSRT